ncbi:hypothetical protein [Gilvibacter sp.]|uniref:hypothetical protein n=1 Tax=Gilvibacter sp. TaxID=2729997 RepID=UPI003F4A5455
MLAVGLLACKSEAEKTTAETADMIVTNAKIAVIGCRAQYGSSHGDQRRTDSQNRLHKKKLTPLKVKTHKSLTRREELSFLD